MRGRSTRARWHDDGLCELCERPSDWFTPFLVSVALVSSRSNCAARAPRSWDIRTLREPPPNPRAAPPARFSSSTTCGRRRPSSPAASTSATSTRSIQVYGVRPSTYSRHSASLANCGKFRQPPSSHSASVVGHDRGVEDTGGVKGAAGTCSPPDSNLSRNARPRNRAASMQANAITPMISAYSALAWPDCGWPLSQPTSGRYADSRVSYKLLLTDRSAKPSRFRPTCSASSTARSSSRPTGGSSSARMIDSRSSISSPRHVTRRLGLCGDSRRGPSPRAATKVLQIGSRRAEIRTRDL
jgi:hypothetical protein